MRDGIVIVDKPAGLTSHDVVQKVKRVFAAKKAGHTGTLDPMATGLLPVCINKATKLSAELMQGDKEYLVEILFGIETDTYDLEGKIVAERETPDDLEERVEKFLPEFRGEIDQKPPYYSAVKYQGKPLYKWAREGKMIDVPPRKVEIKLFEVDKWEKNSLFATIKCSKGTYIRSICHDLGQKVGYGAVMKFLRRTETGGFFIKDSIKLADLEALTSSEDKWNYLKEI